MINHETREALLIHDFQETNGYSEAINMDKMAHLSYRTKHAIVMNSALVRHTHLLETDSEYQDKWENRKIR